MDTDKTNHPYRTHMYRLSKWVNDDINVWMYLAMIKRMIITANIIYSNNVIEEENDRCQEKKHVSHGECFQYVVDVDFLSLRSPQNTRIFPMIPNTPSVMRTTSIILTYNTSLSTISFIPFRL